MALFAYAAGSVASSGPLRVEQGKRYRYRGYVDASALPPDVKNVQEVAAGLAQGLKVGGATNVQTSVSGDRIGLVYDQTAVTTTEIPRDGITVAGLKLVIESVSEV